jgi:hypothetical protein
MTNDGRNLKYQVDIPIVRPITPTAISVDVAENFGESPASEWESKFAAGRRKCRT